MPQPSPDIIATFRFDRSTKNNHLYREVVVQWIANRIMEAEAKEQAA